MKYAHVVSYVQSAVWAIHPRKLHDIMAALAVLAQGGKLSDEEVRAIVAAAQKPPLQPPQGIAVLPLHGTISHRAGMLSESSGGTSTERFTQQLRQALAEPSVGAIVIDVDSPGGTVNGVDELSKEIYDARQTKPIVALANSMAASAAYYLGTAATELHAIPTGEVGSIGVIAGHQDFSGAYAQLGIQTTLVSAGKYKAEFSPFAPLSEEAQAHLQEDVDHYYDLFVKAVARNRGVTAGDVRGGYGEGRLLNAQAAKQLGMIDAVSTPDQALQRAAQLMRENRKGTGASVALERMRLDLSR